MARAYKRDSKGVEIMEGVMIATLACVIVIGAITLYDKFGK